MKIDKIFFFIILLFYFTALAREDDSHKYLFEKITEKPINTPLDNFVEQLLSDNAMKFSKMSSDCVFLRRVYFDLTGTIPTEKEARIFLDDKSANKRLNLIDKLIDSDNFISYWTLKWCDLLRVKSEFPINLWPNGVQAYRRWIFDTIKKNMPYDKFVYKLLTASGSNFKVPQVNFYRAIQDKTSKSIASAVSLTFMGIPFDLMSKKQQEDLEKIFSKVSFKKTAEWKEVIVYSNMLSLDSFDITLPKGKKVKLKYSDDPRKLFAKWLISSDNFYFKRNIVNRIWYWLMGYGIINPPENISNKNTAVSPSLLAYLENELKDSNYNLKHIYKIILNSRTYQQSSIPNPSDIEYAESLFACYSVRRLDAEVLVDSLDFLFNSKESYLSRVPEPFTFIPENKRTITLADASITSAFLEMFGRPSRDTGLESERNNTPTKKQSLYMLNSSYIRNKILKNTRFSVRFKKLNKKDRKARIRFINRLYLAILSRYPSKEEVNTIKAYFMYDKKNKKIKNSRIQDLIWALINSKEFIFKH